METRNRDSPRDEADGFGDTTEMEGTFMYAVTEGAAKINGEMVNTFEREITQGGTTLEVSAGTNGYKSDKSRAGGSRTYIGIDCVNGDFHFSPITDEDGEVVGIEIASCGNESLNAILKALTFAYKVLDEQRRDVND